MIDTSKLGIYEFQGIVKGYDKKVNLTITVDGVVSFQDANLEKTIREAIKKPTGDI